MLIACWLAQPAAGALARAMRLLSEVTEEATPAEVAAGRLSDDKLERLRVALLTHGVALLNGPVVPNAILQKLRPRFEFDAAYRYLDA
eukprot:SAG31_NODE_44144_length_264_cov_0.624242_1_plen_87_part_11